MNRQSQQRGAVLVVALMMLAMITFLVVAFVGFARFERSSVSAAMRRTEASFLMGDALALAQQRAIEDIALVSNNAAGPASLQGLMVSRRNPVSQGDWAPVYIDTDSDGVQDLNSTYLNLNAEINAGGMGDPYFQSTVPARGIVGDPEWLGVLADPAKPHSVNNRYLARMAYMTVPVSRALSLRYNHSVTNWRTLDQVRGQGENARSLDLAAPLYHIDPLLFGQSGTSAKRFGGAFYELGGAVGDAIHFSRPSPGFNQVMGENMAPGLPGAIPRKSVAERLSDVTNPQIFSLSEWFASDGQGRKPFGFYEFMETFSAAKLPDERRGFDISQIRDEVSYGYAYPWGAGMKSLKPHGLKVGVKLEFAGREPTILDPIIFPLISSLHQTDDQMKQAWIDLIASGGPMSTRTPHRLMAGDPVKLVVSGVSNGLRLIHRANSAAPWTPVRNTAVIPSFNQNGWMTRLFPLSPVSPFKISNQNQVQLDLRINGDVAWGRWNAALGQYNVLLNISNPDPNALLPAGLAGASCNLVYRDNALVADPIPYYVKVLGEDLFSLHRSAELDEFSRVRFSGSRAGVTVNFDFQSATGRYTCLNPSPPFFPGDYVRFDISPRQSISISNPAQGALDPTHVFQLELAPVNPPDPNLFGLKVVEGPYAGQYLRLANSGTYRLRLVHRLKHDRLNENVERMAGLMLNESLDVDDTVTPQRFLLGGVELPVPNPASPFPLQLGIGGAPDSMGPWHTPETGIPWGATNNFNGSYIPEIERILQVAANIGDLYSEPGNYEPIRGKDVIGCDNTTNAFFALLPFQGAVSDGVVSAKIRYTWGQSNINGQTVYNTAGLALGDYSISFTPLRVLPNNRVRARVVLKKTGVAAPVAHSGPVDVALTQGNDNGGQWEWSLNKFIWRDGLDPVAQNNSWIGMDLGLELESGRFVRVYLGGRKVIEYESTTRSVPGQMGVWVAPGTKAYVTSVMPGIPRAQLPLAGVNGWRLLATPVALFGKMPTLYQGHFRRDRDNNVFLAGVQRTASLQNSSWYLRDAPNLLGVKDRAARYGGRMPSISEANLRLVYNRNGVSPNGSVSARLSLETDVPQVLQNGGAMYHLQITGLRVRYNVEALYKNSRTGAVSPAPVVPVDFVPPITSFALPIIPLSESGFLITVLADLPTVQVPRGIVSGGGGSPLVDIRIKDVEVFINAFVLGNNGARIVDFFSGNLEKNDLSLGDPMIGHELYAPVWDPQVAANNGYGGAGNTSVVLYPPPNGTAQWTPRFWVATSNTGVAPGTPQSPWSVAIDNIRQLRKVDCSWQVNDPLVNGRTHGWRNRVYSPSYIGSNGLVPNAGETKVLWMNASHRDPVIQPRTTFSSAKFSANNNGRHVRRYVGVNICRSNDESRYWGRFNGGNDLTFKDPGIGDPGVGNRWWTFPDISIGGIQTVGWLGQVHRGTPWQTLYMKSKEPGKKPIIAFDNANGFLTVPNHSFITGQYLGVRGRCPLAWANVQTNAFGMIAAGQLTGYAEVSGSQIRLWPSANPNSWLAGTDVLSGIGAAQALSGLDLVDINGTSWRNWAGSPDTKPQNDRRLLEAFQISNGKPLRGRFSINNPSENAWSSVLHGISIPYASATGVPSGAIGAISVTGRAGTIRTDMGANDTRWNQQLLKGVFDEKANSGGRLSRVTDILSVPALTDESPFLPNVLGVQNLNQYYAAVSKVDELDIERIPQQILSLLKVGGPQRYQTYIFMEQLRPARSYNIISNGAPTASAGVSGGVVKNYEVVSQNAVRVLYDIEGADAWARSLKRGHFGKRRDASGGLVPLSPPRLRVIETLPIHLGN